MEILVRPEFVADQGAPAEATITFNALDALISKDPAGALAAFGHLDHEALVDAAARLAPDDDSVTAQATRVLAEIFKNQYDQDGDFDLVTDKAARLVRQSGSEAGTRLRRVGVLATHLAAWYMQHPAEEQTLRPAA